MTGPEGMTCTVASHEQMKQDTAVWSQLRWVGLQVFDAEDGEPVERYELRDCECGSTLCKRVS